MRIDSNVMTNNKSSFIVSVALEDVPEGKSFSDAIKGYEDEFYTGLTDEERDKINQEIAKYKETNKVETKEDAKALQKFIAGLLKKYGYKGDVDEMAGAMALIDDNDNFGNGVTQKVNEVMEVYQKMKNNGIRS